VITIFFGKIADDMYISFELTGSTATSYKDSRFNNWLVYENSNPNIFLKDLCLILKNGTNLIATDCQAQRAFLCENKSPPPAPTTPLADSWYLSFNLAHCSSQNLMRSFFRKDPPAGSKFVMIQVT
jgi:hypothetical protein